MRVARVLLVAVGGLVLLVAVGAAGFALGKADAVRSPIAAPTSDPCAAEAAAYANASSSSNGIIFARVRDDYQTCRAGHR